MANLQDIINLAEADGGKFFVIDESGEAKLVIMPVEDYQRLLLGKLQKQVEDVEEVNQEIIKAQLSEDEPPAGIKTLTPTGASGLRGPTVIQEPEISKTDLRAEVIDPSFDFEGPKVEIDDL